jgi:hypothetical protein
VEVDLSSSSSDEVLDLPVELVFDSEDSFEENYLGQKKRTDNPKHPTREAEITNRKDDGLLYG